MDVRAYCSRVVLGVVTALVRSLLYVCNIGCYVHVRAYAVAVSLGALTNLIIIIVMTRARWHSKNQTFVTVMNLRQLVFTPPKRHPHNLTEKKKKKERKKRKKKKKRHV